MRSDYHAGTSWAPVGQTPIVKATGARHSLNMISAVTAQGRLRFSTYTGGFTAERFIEFCKKLIHDTDGAVYLVVDGHPTHKASAVKRFVEGTNGALKLFVLPASSPQLNLDEWVWKNVKRPPRAHQRQDRRGIQSHDHRRTPPPARHAPPRARILRRPRPALHHRKSPLTYNLLSKFDPGSQWWAAHCRLEHEGPTLSIPVRFLRATAFM